MFPSLASLTERIEGAEGEERAIRVGRCAVHVFGELYFLVRVRGGFLVVRPLHLLPIQVSVEVRLSARQAPVK